MRFTDKGLIEFSSKNTASKKAAATKRLQASAYPGRSSPPPVARRPP
ncbi:hypothetical protein APV28_1404 [Comamonas testosteroni]|nr:hypothetical protein APV28_1404 [Comamonas testosteroni]